MTREYVDNMRTRITTYTLTKVIEYQNEDVAKWQEKMLDMLRVATFKHILIPEFEYSRDGSELTIVTDYIKGWYCVDKQLIWEDVVKREGEYTFNDPHPSNFITCKRELKTYAVDLDSYCHLPDFGERVAMFKGIWGESCE